MNVKRNVIMRYFIPFFLIGSLLSYTMDVYAASTLSLSVSPNVITLNTTTQVTYTIKNSSSAPFTNAYVSVPSILPVVSAGTTSYIPVTLAKGTTCAINSTYAGALRVGSSCKLVFNIAATQYGRLEFSDIKAYSTENGTITLSKTSILIQPSKLFFFGDSYTDIGLVNPPTAPNWVNTQKWPVYLGQDLQLAGILPATQAGGTDYACGGAHTGYEYGGKYTPNTYGVLDQIDMLFKPVYSVTPFDQGAVTFIWAGGNDLKGSNPTPIPTIVDNLKTALTKLNALGVRQIVMMNQGPWSSTFNTSLAKMVKDYNTANASVPGFIPVVLFDYSAAFTQLYTNPAKYGFADVTRLCNNNLDICTDADRLNTDVIPFLNAAPGTKVTAPIIAWYFSDGHATPAGYQYIEARVRDYLFPPVQK